MRLNMCLCGYTPTGDGSPDQNTSRPKAFPRNPSLLDETRRLCEMHVKMIAPLPARRFGDRPLGKKAQVVIVYYNDDTFNIIYLPRISPTISYYNNTVIKILLWSTNVYFNRTDSYTTKQLLSVVTLFKKKGKKKNIFFFFIFPPSPAICLFVHSERSSYYTYIRRLCSFNSLFFANFKYLHSLHYDDVVVAVVTTLQ